jgi:hypothetical protein
MPEELAPRDVPSGSAGAWQRYFTGRPDPAGQISRRQAAEATGRLRPASDPHRAKRDGPPTCCSWCRRFGHFRPEGDLSQAWGPTPASLPHPGDRELIGPTNDVLSICSNTPLVLCERIPKESHVRTDQNYTLSSCCHCRMLTA